MSDRPLHHSPVPYKVTSCQLISDLLSNSPSKKSLFVPSTPDPPKTLPLPLKDSMRTSTGTEDFMVTNRRNGRTLDLAESWDPEHHLFNNDPPEDSLSLSCRPNLSPLRKCAWESKGPIEARIEKFTGIDKALFQPKRGSFSSPKIVRANHAKRLGFSDSKLRTDINKIYKVETFKRRVSTSILLDNFRIKPASGSTKCITPRKESENENVSFPVVPPFARPLMPSVMPRGNRNGSLLGFVKKEVSFTYCGSVREELLKAAKMK